MLGESTYLTFEIENFSEQDLYTSVGGDYRNRLGKSDSYKIIVIKEDGSKVSQPDVGMGFGGLLGSSSIPAKDKFTKKMYLDNWATFTEPGNYTITFSKSFSITNRKTKVREVFKVKTSSKISILPYDLDEMGDVIDNLGKKMLDINNPEARRSLTLLDKINDVRAIRYFVKALELYSKVNEDWRERTDRENRIEDVYKGVALTLKFNDDNALKALKNAMKSRNKDARRYVAIALSYSKHLKAIDLLIKMQDDSYDSVRLRVMWAIAGLNTEESIAILRKYAQDKDENVREQAQNYLKKLNKVFPKPNL